MERLPLVARLVDGVAQLLQGGYFRRLLPLLPCRSRPLTASHSSRGAGRRRAALCRPCLRVPAPCCRRGIGSGCRPGCNQLPQPGRRSVSRAAAAVRAWQRLCCRCLGADAADTGNTTANACDLAAADAGHSRVYWHCRLRRRRLAAGCITASCIRRRRCRRRRHWLGCCRAVVLGDMIHRHAFELGQADLQVVKQGFVRETFFALNCQRLVRQQHASSVKRCVGGPLLQAAVLFKICFPVGLCTTCTLELSRHIAQVPHTPPSVLNPRCSKARQLPHSPRCRGRRRPSGSGSPCPSAPQPRSRCQSPSS